MLTLRQIFRGACSLLGLSALVFALTGPAAAAGDVVGFSVKYSLDGESFFPEIDVAPGQAVMVRVELTPGPGGLMDVMGEDDFDFSRIGGDVEVIAGFAGVEDGPCFVIIDEEEGRLKVRCPFCDIASNELGVLDFTIQVRDDADSGPITQVLRVWDIGPGEEGEDRPCTTFGPEPVGPPLAEEPRDLGCRVVAPALLVETEVGLDGSIFGPEVDVSPGDDVFFRVRIVNDGVIPFFEANIESLFPAGFGDLEIISAGPSPCEIVGDQIRCADLGGVEPGTRLEVVFKATVVAEEGIIESIVQSTVTPGTRENPGVAITNQGGAQVRVGIVEPIPTLDTIGVLLLAGALGFALIAYGRRG